MNDTTRKSLEVMAYKWACGEVSNEQFKFSLYFAGYTIDLRQADNGNKLELVHKVTGKVETIEV